MPKLVLYSLIVVAVIAVLVAFFRPGSSETEVPISAFLVDAKLGKVALVEVRGDRLDVVLKDNMEYVSRKESGLSLVSVLADNGVPPETMTIRVQQPSEASDWLGLVIQFVPILIFVALIFYAVRRATTPPSAR